ncbi:hypothetical protein V1506DRAFT_35211 [Lipomyces tetrasporus]
MASPRSLRVAACFVVASFLCRVLVMCACWGGTPSADTQSVRLWVFAVVAYSTRLVAPPRLFECDNTYLLLLTTTTAAAAAAAVIPRHWARPATRQAGMKPAFVVGRPCVSPYLNRFTKSAFVDLSRPIPFCCRFYISAATNSPIRWCGQELELS